MMETPSTTHTPRDPISWMAGHSVTANLLMVVLLVGGLIWGTRIKQEVFPDFDLDFITISVAYPGASPSEVERGIIWAIEEAVQGLEGVEEVTASANEGVGTVTVEVLEGADPNRLSEKIQNEVDQISSFPDEAETPKVAIADRKRSVVSIILHGDQSEWTLRELAEDLRMRMLQDPDITQVDLEGIRDFEISIEIPQRTLRAYGLTLDEVAQKIGAAAVELPEVQRDAHIGLKIAFPGTGHDPVGFQKQGEIFFHDTRDVFLQRSAPAMEFVHLQPIAAAARDDGGTIEFVRKLDGSDADCQGLRGIRRQRRRGRIDRAQGVVNRIGRGAETPCQARDQHPQRQKLPYASIHHCASLPFP